MGANEPNSSLSAASVDACQLVRPALLRASSNMGSGEIWQLAADMDEAVAQSHPVTIANSATTGEPCATGKKWSVVGSTSRKVHKLFFADRSASFADGKTKRLLPSLLSTARRQQGGQSISVREVASGSLRVASESAAEAATDGDDWGGLDGPRRRSFSFQPPELDSGREIRREKSAERLDILGPRAAVADSEGWNRGEGGLSPFVTTTAERANTVNGAVLASESALGIPDRRVPPAAIAVLPRPARPQTAPGKGAASAAQKEKPRDLNVFRGDVAEVVVLEVSVPGSGASLSASKPADEDLCFPTPPSAAAPLTLTEPSSPALNAVPSPSLPSPVAPRPPSSGGPRSEGGSRRHRSRQSDELAWAEALGGEAMVRSKTAERAKSPRGRVGRGRASAGGHHHLWASWDCESEARKGMESGGGESGQDVEVSEDVGNWGDAGGRERQVSRGRLSGCAVSPRVVRFSFKQHMQQVALAAAHDELAQQV